MGAQLLGQLFTLRPASSFFGSFASLASKMSAFPRDISNFITCMSQSSDFDRCMKQDDDLAKLAVDEEVKKGTAEKAKDFCNKAGYKLAAVPVLYVALKFIKIK